MSPDDLPAVAALYERVARSGSSTPVPGLEDRFRRLLFEHPWADPEIPSLIYEDEGGVRGFSGTHVRRLRHGDRVLRAAYSGQLVVAPEARSRAVGVLLSARLFAGRQDLTLTDGANAATVAIWSACGARRFPLASLEWTWVLRPGGFATEVVERRARNEAARRIARGAGRVAGAVTEVRSGRRPAGLPADVTTEPLEAEDLVTDLEALVPAGAGRPLYDRPFAAWLLAELARVTGRGRLRAERVLRAGRCIGLYVAFVPRGGTAALVHLTARPGDLPLVLAEVIARSRRDGAVALQGRMEANVLDAVVDPRCFVRPRTAVMVHSREVGIMDDVLTGRILLTRLEGEWWMDTHLEGDSRVPVDAGATTAG
jgi:hypothetical protein